MLKLKDKVALITGGGRGIGRAIALAFARDGAACVVAARTLARVEQVAAEVAALGQPALALECDVTRRESVTAMAVAAAARFGRIDILVNNAGIAKSQPLARMTDDLWAEIIGVNLTGTYLCTRAVIEGMLSRRSGRVINIASIAGKLGMPYVSAYTASKHGVVGFTRSVALEVAAHGITVNAICPGYVETEMARAAIDNIVSKTRRTAEEARAALEGMNPQRRLIEPEEVAAVALLLASEEGRGINGQAINICGGAAPF